MDPWFEGRADDKSGFSWIEHLIILVYPFNISVVVILAITWVLVFTEYFFRGPAKLEQTHQYLSEPDKVKCRRAQWQFHGSHELVIMQLTHRFYVTNLSAKACEDLRAEVDDWINFEPPQPLPLWHDGYVVYQLGEYGNMLDYETQYKRLKPNYAVDEEERMEWLLTLWFLYWLFRLWYYDKYGFGKDLPDYKSGD